MDREALQSILEHLNQQDYLSDVEQLVAKLDELGIEISAEMIRARLPELAARGICSQRVEKSLEGAIDVRDESSLPWWTPEYQGE